MTRTLKNKHPIAVRIAEVLGKKHDRWVEDVLRLIGWYTGPVGGVHRVRVEAPRRRPQSRGYRPA